MTDREKLVELLSGVQAGGVALDHEALKANAVQNEEVAEYLISHGVTVRQMQKPLTVEETLEKRVVYLEFRHLVLQEPVVMFRDWDEWEEDVIIYYDRFGSQHSNTDCQESDYGKSWRCWASRPTEEERKAAEWME